MDEPKLTVQLLRDIKEMLMHLAAMVFFAALIAFVDSPLPRSIGLLGCVWCLRCVRKAYDRGKCTAGPIDSVKED